MNEAENPEAKLERNRVGGRHVKEEGSALGMKWRREGKRETVVKGQKE